MPLAACDPCQATYVVGQRNPGERFCPKCGAPLREMSSEEAATYLRQLTDRSGPSPRNSADRNAHSG